VLILGRFGERKQVLDKLHTGSDDAFSTSSCRSRGE
jgi:hypothetical protein